MKGVFTIAEKKRGAREAGTIRQRADGRWEARFVIGVDPGTGKDIRKSVYAPTQKEARKKMTEAFAALDSGAYKEPRKMTVGQWLDIWTTEYINNLKPRTVESYQYQIKNHIRPALGAGKPETLNAHTIQQFYNRLGEEKGGKPGPSPKSIKIIHGVLHKAISQAVAIGYLSFNPADPCTLPRVERKEIKPLDKDATGRFLEAVKGHRYEAVSLHPVH